MTGSQSRSLTRIDSTAAEVNPSHRPQLTWRALESVRVITHGLTGCLEESMRVIQHELTGPLRESIRVIQHELTGRLQASIRVTWHG
jgi:hypothetical protein